MKKRFTEEQIIGFFNETDAGYWPLHPSLFSDAELSRLHRSNHTSGHSSEQLNGPSGQGICRSQCAEFVPQIG